MRTLNDYFIDGGNRSGIHTVSVVSPYVTVPDDGTIKAVAVSISNSATTVAHSFDIIKNGTDTGVDLKLTAAIAVNTGLLAYPDGTVNVVAGDSLLLNSNGETGNTPTAHLNWIIRR